jgi:hypothetical protein
MSAAPAWLFNLVLHQVVPAGLLALAVLAVERLAGRRLGPGARCALWLLVVIRLVLPGELAAPFSLTHLAGRLHPGAAGFFSELPRPAAPAAGTRAPWFPLLTALWAAGALGVLAWQARGAWRLRRALRDRVRHIARFRPGGRPSRLAGPLVLLLAAVGLTSPPGRGVAEDLTTAAQLGHPRLRAAGAAGRGRGCGGHARGLAAGRRTA